jgi:dUTP pyrophosphatase
MANSLPQIGFVKNHEAAMLPSCNQPDAKTGDTGYDLYCVESSYIQPKTSSVIDVGLTVGYIEPGYWFQIMPRSGLGFKRGIQPHLGVIDNQYRGSLAVKLYNFSDNPVSINKGDRIAQIVIHQLHQAKMQFVDNISETTRGSCGLGSSGT